jgi:hypothetical protein
MVYKLEKEEQETTYVIETEIYLEPRKRLRARKKRKRKLVSVLFSFCITYQRRVSI